ncbi:hypothetical protein OG21DRAFT_621524 [Imleria badia]|nr:hypothetical protein OG21DRAFT_621524 [Imleria badia]
MALILTRFVATAAGSGRFIALGRSAGPGGRVKLARPRPITLHRQTRLHHCTQATAHPRGDVVSLEPVPHHPRCVSQRSALSTHHSSVYSHKDGECRAYGHRSSFATHTTRSQKASRLHVASRDFHSIPLHFISCAI